MPIETITYVLKKRFPRAGLQVSTLFDYERLGLERYFARIEFSPAARDYASEILHKLASVAFLTYRSRLMPEPGQIAIFAVPVALKGEFDTFLERLIGEGIVQSVELEILEWTRHPEIKPKYYDFSSGRWSVDWKEVGARQEIPPSPIPNYEPVPRPDVDKVDILLIKELEIDSCASISEVARKLGFNERTLRWHHNKHVRPIIASHYVRWFPPGSVDSKVMGMVLEFREILTHTLSKVRRVFNNFPFTAYEAGRRGGYYQAHLAIPTEQIVESLRFLGKSLGEIDTRWETHFEDLSSSLSYTIPYECFDKSQGWYFDQRQALESILAFKTATKKIGSAPQ
jgi:DNA-binding Lrp family transcriptional regulator